MPPKPRVLKIPHDWKPREYQLKAWGALEGGKKRALLVWHRRSGKDDVGMHWSCTQIVQRVGTYWHMLPEYAQARKAIWEAVDPHKGKRRIDIAFPKEIRESTREDTMSIRFKNGSYWHLVGSDNYDSLVGTPPVGIVCSEWALADPNAWGYIRPILLENNGWAVFVTTSRGRNHVSKMYEDYRDDPEWFVELLKATETGVFDAKQLEHERREYVNDFGTEAGNALFEQEYLCSFDAPTFGAYFAAELRRMEDDDRLTSIPIDRSVPVQTAWDLGYSDSTAIWFIQCVGKERRLIDYHEASGMGFDYYAKILKEKGYVYGEHYFPHDIAQSMIGMEKSRIDTLRGLGITATIVPKGNVEDGINATRRLLDSCWIDRKRCARGLECLRQYRREWDEKGKVWKPKPLHDWACLIGETEVLTRYGKHQIQNLPKEGEVLTPCGWKPYINPHMTKKSAPLVEVKFTDGHTVKCTPDHLFLTARGWRYAENLTKDLPIRSSLMHLHSISTAAYIGYGLLKGTLAEAGRNFIETCGRWLSDQYQRGATSITETAFMPTITLKTLSAYPPPNTYQSRGNHINAEGQSISQLWRESVQRSGIIRKLAGYGIEGMPRELSLGPDGSEYRRIARSVEKSFSASLGQEDTRKSTALNPAKWLRIESVKRLTETQDVWCLTVPETGCFSLANGAVVHNSHGADSLRTFAVGFAERHSEVRPRRYSRLSAGSWMAGLWLLLAIMGGIGC